MHRIGGRDLPRDGARHQCVGRQGQVGAVLFEAPDGKDGDLAGDTGPRSRTSSVVSSDSTPDSITRVPELLIFHGPFDSA